MSLNRLPASWSRSQVNVDSRADEKCEKAKWTRKLSSTRLIVSDISSGNKLDIKAKEAQNSSRFASFRLVEPDFVGASGKFSVSDRLARVIS